MRYGVLFGLCIGLILGVVWGIAFYKYQIFPFKEIKKIRKSLKKEPLHGPWSIGLYAGNDILNLTDDATVSNPILTWEDVKDIDAEFVADPFFMVQDDSYYLFFEVMDRLTNLGVIAYASSRDGVNWAYNRVILQEGFHLSYPYVFKWEDDYFMIPETHEDLSIRLYRATSFPEKWEHVGDLMKGYHYTDASVFRYDGKWWLFVSNTYNDVLNLYYADELLDDWHAHPLNPIMKLDQHRSRPAGRVVVDDNKIYRFAQDDFPSYGIHVFAFEITELSEMTYQEKLVEKEPFLGPTGKGWNAAGMHHIDLQKIGKRWVSVVDGRYQ